MSDNKHDKEMTEAELKKAAGGQRNPNEHFDVREGDPDASGSAGSSGSASKPVNPINPATGQEE